MAAGYYCCYSQKSWYRQTGWTSSLGDGCWIRLFADDALVLVETAANFAGGADACVPVVVHLALVAPGAAGVVLAGTVGMG